jgi:GR25 family glycosyltransferase involved in LPS biosynthesis
MYHIFDSVFCINLKERTDRYEQSKELFDKLNIPVEYLFVDKHPSNGSIGCFESHINAVKKSYYKGDNYVLIFEDDIVETSSFNETVMLDISQFLKNTDCEYFQLGYSILDMTEFISFVSAKTHMINNTCIMEYNGLLCHSYILNRNGMKRIIDHYETANTTHIDVFYKDLFKGASICPLLFEQNFCMKSDNSKAENMYFTILRKLSCFQSKISLFYVLSCLKRYILYLLGLLILLFLFKYNKYIWKKKYLGYYIS